jgi:pimeloyl-ACP methyl ester carboxylesterase
VAEPALRRSYVSTASGSYQRRPSNKFVTTLGPMGAELFDVYRSLECRLLIYNCVAVRPSPFGDELYRAYRQSIAADLDALVADRPNVTVATLDCGHMAFFEKPAEVLAALLAFTAPGAGG